MLWLSLYLPHLTLEVYLRGTAPDAHRPFTVIQVIGNRQLVCGYNRAAGLLGITAGMPLSAARSLCGHLEARLRDERAEAAALASLAAWAGQYTSLVSLQPPNGLLLEIQGSLRLFDGLESLRARITQGLADLGYHGYLGIAPTPLAAWLLARAGRTEPVVQAERLAATLHQLPLTLLEQPQELITALHRMGLRHLGDCMRLPRSGLAKRLGAELIAYLDRALGHAPDPRPRYTPPDHFESHLPLPAEVENSEALLFASRRLLLELSGFLIARCAGVQELRLLLHHSNRSSTTLHIGLLSPAYDTEHFTALLRERLAQHTLAAPVDALSLHADQLITHTAANRDLFSEINERADWRRLIERLRARLGPDAVTCLSPHADHRPEKSCAEIDTPRPAAAPPLGRRPHWLLHAPQPLETRNDHPWLDCPLQLISGPERIESGWWDEHDATRDYFIALGAHGEQLWIYRDLKQNEWFVQGMFG